MYFINVKNDKFVKIIIRREIHLINNFKINMFINNNVIDFEKWQVNYEKRNVVINSCGVTIFVNIQRRFIG